MSGFLRDAGLASQVVAYAYFGLMVAAVGLSMLAPLAGRLFGRKTRLVKPFEALLATAVVIGIPAAFSALAALFVTPLLLAMPLPTSAWLLIAAFAIFGFWGSEASSGEMGGCTKMIGIGISAFGLSWAVTAMVLADPPAGNLGAVLRPLLVAAPLGLFLGVTNSRKQAKTAIGASLLFAVLMAISFLPVERGFAANLLPASDWLRFPIAGAIVFGFWPLLSIPLTLIFGKRAIRWKETTRAIVGLGLVGLVFGFLWSAVRALFVLLGVNA